MSDDMPGMRASHEDRDRVVDTLRVAAGEGRLSAEELDTRLERALSARTLGELAGLTADPPNATAAKEVLVIRQHAGKYVQEGRWLVPACIELRTQMCRVTLDFTHAVITSSVLRIDADMQHGKLFIVSPPGIVINTDGLALTYSKLKLRSKDAAADPRLRIELAGRLLHAKVIEQRPQRRKAAGRWPRWTRSPRPRRHPVLAALRTSPQDCGPQGRTSPRIHRTIALTQGQDKACTPGGASRLGTAYRTRRGTALRAPRPAETLSRKTGPLNRPVTGG